MTDAATLADLQALLDRSISGSGDHLRSIVVPGERTLSARQLVAALTGVCHLVVATTTARCQPRVSAVDGHFVDGRFLFPTTTSSVKARHLAARPAVSAAHVRGDDLGVFLHGQAVMLRAGDDGFDTYDERLGAHYGSRPSTWTDDVVYVRLDPHWMVAYAFEADRWPEG